MKLKTAAAACVLGLLVLGLYAIRFQPVGSFHGCPVVVNRWTGEYYFVTPHKLIPVSDQ